MADTPKNENKGTMVESPGKRLQAARQQRGWTVEDVARMTKMRVVQVRDLEKDDYKNFANLAYAKSFLKMYAKFLHLDLKEAIDHLYLPEKFGIEDYQYLNAPLDDEPAYRPSRPSRRSTSSQTLRSSGGSGLKWVVFVVLALLVVAVGGGLWVNVQRLDLGDSADKSSDAAVVKETADPAAPATPKARPTGVDPVESAAPPRALPVHTPDAAPAPALDVPSASATAIPEPSPVFSVTPAANPSPSEPEIRRAEPVKPLPQ